MDRIQRSRIKRESPTHFVSYSSNKLEKYDYKYRYRIRRGKYSSPLNTPQPPLAISIMDTLNRRITNKEEQDIGFHFNFTTLYISLPYIKTVTLEYIKKFISTLRYKLDLPNEFSTTENNSPTNSRRCLTCSDHDHRHTYVLYKRSCGEKSHNLGPSKSVAGAIPR